MAEDGAEASSPSLSLRGFVLTAIRLAHTRLQILATEIAEEKERFVLVLATAVAAVFFLGLAVVLGSLLLVVLFWETHRVVLLSLLAAGFALLGAVLLVATLRSLANRGRLFQVTLAELKKDDDAWRTAHGDD